MMFYTPFSSRRTMNVILSQAETDTDGHLHAHTLIGAHMLVHKCTQQSSEHV